MMKTYDVIEHLSNLQCHIVSDDARRPDQRVNAVLELQHEIRKAHAAERAHQRKLERTIMRATALYKEL